MECEAARQAMLECEPRELEARGDGPLAAHLEGCEACRRRARTIAAELRALDAALAAVAEGRAAAERSAGADAAAGTEAAGWRSSARTDAGAPRGLAAGMSGSGPWERAWRLAAPLAAAAAIVGLVLAWPGSRPGGPAGPGSTAAGPAAPASEAGASGGRLRVRVPDDRRVAVFQTRDPSVAVVWFFPKTNGG